MGDAWTPVVAADPWAPVADAWTPALAPPASPKPAVDPWAPLKQVASTFKQTGGNILSDMGERAHAGAATFMEGLHQTGGQDGEAADPLNSVAGLAKMAGGGWSVLASPVAGAAEALVGRPLDAATKNAPRGHIGPVPYDLHIPKSLMGDYVDTVSGFVAGDPWAPKGSSILATTKYRPFKPTAEEAASAIEGSAREVPPKADGWTPVEGPLAPAADDWAPMDAATPETPPVAAPVNANGRPSKWVEGANEEIGGHGVPDQYSVPLPDEPVNLTRLYSADHSPAEEAKFGFGPVNDGWLPAKVEDPLDSVLYAPKARREGTLTLPDPTTVAPKGVKENLMDAAGAVQKILAPATVGEGPDAAATIRRASAESDLLGAQSAHTLVKHAAQVSELSVPEQRSLVSYIETRSSGAQLTDPGLQKTADAIRDVNQSYRDRIEKVMGIDDGPSFITDYYAHMWKESPDVVANRIVAGRQGSGKNLKARSIPTLQEGIDVGLTPVTENPIEATLMYANNMGRYLSTVDVQKELGDTAMTKWAPPGQQPPGWTRLQGIRTDKPARVVIQDGETHAALPPQYLYASPDVARVYNNWISSGFERGDAAGLFDPIRKTANGMTMLKLGLSAFHATTMAQESVISELARGIQAGTRGDMGTALKATAGAPGAFIGRAVRGGRMRQELLGMKPPDGLSAEVNRAFIRAGGRVRMDPLLRTRGAGSFYNALKNGTWKRELLDTAKRIGGPQGGLRPLDRLGGIVDLAANLVQSTAAPLFEEYIPRLKQGAFASNMEDWIRANPSATQKEMDVAAHLINRSIDNRFGEMAWDNLFWHRYMKQASQIILLSPTWNIGTLNEIGGGLADMLGASAKGVITGKGVTQRTAYVAALASFVPLINGVMTYLKTGTAPKGMDFLAYRTGGTDVTSNQPERALLPGYQKDVYAFGWDFPNHIGQEVANKLNPALKTAIELGSNKDYRGLPIRPEKGAVAQPGDAGIGDYLLEAFMPISLGQARKGDKRGSNISTAEKTLAIKPAPAYLQSPERVERLQDSQHRHDWLRKQRADRRDAARRAP